MNNPERRTPHIPANPRESLTPQQQQAVETLEFFGWHLKFVRRPLFRDPIPVLFERAGTRYVVVLPDGTLDESQTLKLRN